MGNVHHIDEIGILIHDVEEMYKRGLIDDVIIILDRKDGILDTVVSSGIDTIRAIGMLETAKYITIDRDDEGAPLG